MIMKKVFLGIGLCLCLVGTTFAQGGAAKKKAEVKEGLKQELKLSDEIVSQIVELQDDYKSKIREVKKNESLTEEAKKVATDKLRKEKNAEMEKKFGKDTAKKVEDLLEKLGKKEEKGKTKKDK